MKITYDQDVDILYIRLNDTPIEETTNEFPNIHLDLDIDGNMIGIEIMNVSKRDIYPTKVELEIA